MFLYLRHHVNPVLHVLRLQEGVEVGDGDPQLFLSVLSGRDHHRQLLPGHARGGDEATVVETLLREIELEREINYMM